jgi:DNA-binding SARP family transcriptional activator/TolB-like protein
VIPSLELRFLGGLSVRTQAGGEVAGVLAQPKRLALLAYLAAATPHGFQRRDALLALFWPEADQEHARTSLRKALHFLRHELGPDVIVSRGDEEVGIDRARCRCDVVEFEEAAEGGRAEEAVGLYRGELLAGFHLSDTPEFERWLDEARARLRDRALRAAWTLAEREAAQGRLPAAVAWAKRAVALSPYDEIGLRRLVTHLDQAGDRAAAVVAFEQFAQRLSTDLELEPSADTLALLESIRTRQPALGREPAASLIPEPNGNRPGIREPPEAALPPRTLPSRARLAGVGLLVVGMAAAIGAAFWSQRVPALPRSPTAIAILPFEYRGNPALSYLADGMVDLLNTRLEGAAGLSSIDSRALRSFASRQVGMSDPERGRRAAERFGAGFFVLGSMVEAGGRLQISATIYDARSRARSSMEIVAGKESAIFDVADSIARRILAGMQDRPAALTAVAGQTTSSLPALKAYLEGERELREGRESPAQDAFRRATELDTTFALAYYRLAMVSDDQPALEALAHALRHSDRLAQRHRWMVEMMAASLRGDHTTADQRARQIVTIRPDDAEGWFMLARATLGKGHLLGRAWVDAREAYERALAVGPDNAEAVWWLAAIAATERRRSDLDSLTDRLLRLDPAPWLAGNAQAQRAIMMGDAAGEARFVADLRARPDPWAQSSAGVVTWTTGDLRAGRRLWRLITEPTRSRGFRVMAHVTLAKIELTNGRRAAASAELAALEALDRAAALEHRAHYALTRFLETPRSELLALRDSLQRWDPSSARTEGDGLIAIHRSAHPYLRLYLLGMLSARLGEPLAALRFAAQLERADRSSPMAVFARDQGRFVRAEVAWQGQRREEAFTLLDQAQYWTTDSRREASGDSPFFIQLHERFARAELLYELGRYPEALPWYRALSYDFLYAGPAHLRLARIYERQGDRQAAIEHYTRFVELWGRCDAEFRPKVQQAEAALDSLRLQLMVGSANGDPASLPRHSPAAPDRRHARPPPRTGSSPARGRGRAAAPTPGARG